MLTFTNPRLKADFDDWPSGKDRVKCHFEIERTKKGWRVQRTTTNKYGAWCKPKTSTFAGPSCIVDGSDGKTYILKFAGIYDFITVMRHDFMDASQEMDRPGKGASVFKDQEPDYHKALFDLILQSGASLMYIG